MNGAVGPKPLDRWLALAAVVAVIVVVGLIVTAVRDAEENGRTTREDMRLEQVKQLANSMESRVQSAYASFLAGQGAPGSFTMEPGNPVDAERLRPQSAAARTGNVLVDTAGIVVNGSLLRDPSVVGTSLDRPGLDRVLAGEPAILPVAPGLTTASPTIAVAVPTRNAAGGIVGAYLTEVEVAPDSSFNDEVSELRAGETGGFSFVDEEGVVVASSDEGLLAEPLAPPTGRGFEPGFHRRGDQVTAIATVPSARWNLVFQQSVEDFEGDLVGPLRSAIVLLAVLAVLAGGGLVVVLLRRLRAAREEESRLRQLNREHEEFTSIVSHELRTPVAGLVGFLQTSLDHWDTMSEGERQSAVRRAWANAHHLHTLTRDVFDTARVDASELGYDFDTIDLRTVVDDATADARQLQPGRPLEVREPGGPLWVRADEHRMQQVLTNLLDNAMKNSPEDSPVTVAVSRGEREVRVEVADRGPGIPATERGRIFDKYVRGRGANSRGSGLGLYIARSIVEAHGGRIWAGNSATGGALIGFTVPLSTAPDAEPGDRPSVGTAPPASEPA